MPAFVAIRNGPFRGVSRQLVRLWAARMMQSLDLARAELSVVLTDDREIHELNSVFRHRDRPTDVLAFAMREGEPLGGASSTGRSAEILGDVVISVETARRQATERRRPLEAELCMLLAHGLLHLVGYDHRNDREEAVMTAETERLCRVARRPASKKAEPSARATRTGARPRNWAKSRAQQPPKSRASATKRGARVRSSGSKNGTSKRAASRKGAR